VVSPETILSEEIIQRAQSLDPEAFDEIIDRYSPRLHAFLRRHTGNWDDAQELVQEVFVRVVRMIQHYKHDGRFEAWLFRIAMNLARDQARRRARRPEISSFDTSDSDQNGDDSGWNRIPDRSLEQPDRSSQRSEDIDRMQHALAKLPRAEREVILLRHYGQMNYADIAEMMETPLGTALARAHRGLGKLRQYMEDRT